MALNGFSLNVLFTDPQREFSVLIARMGGRCFIDARATSTVVQEDDVGSLSRGVRFHARHEVRINYNFYYTAFPDSSKQSLSNKATDGLNRECLSNPTRTLTPAATYAAPEIAA